MWEQDFDRLVASIRQTRAIRRSERQPSRTSEFPPSICKRSAEPSLCAWYCQSRSPLSHLRENHSPLFRRDYQ